MPRMPKANNIAKTNRKFENQINVSTERMYGNYVHVIKNGVLKEMFNSTPLHQRVQGERKNYIC